ncbi:MAG: hypothetical protein ACM3MM_07935 [Acidobacteriota bacterium]
METNIDGQTTWSRLVAQWQPAVLVTACVAGGLTLTMMVIGSTPDVIVQASQAAIEAAPVDTLGSDAPVVAEVPVDTASSTDSTEVVGQTAAEAAAPATGEASAASLEPATVVAPARGPAPEVPSPAPTATPTTGTPPAPAPAPVVTSGPLAPVTVAAPQTTAAPTTAAPTPAPTTAAPTPTTVAPAASLTYPSYSAGSAATVVLQFDGSSIYVASVTRQANWVSQVDKNGPRTVEIKFFNTATRQDEEFHATVEGGRIKVEN